MLRNIKNFLWGTFNYRNKGMSMRQYVQTGYNFMKIQNGTLKTNNY